MHILLISEPGSVYRAFDIEGGELTIGRSPDNDLRLPNVSVSRQHAHIAWTDGGYHINDAGSHNGIYVNGKRKETHLLSSGDELRIGKYDMVYLTDPVPSKFRVLNIDSMPRWYGVTMATADESTFQVPPAMVQRIIRARKVLASGVVLADDGSGNWWEPQDGELVFGKEAAVAISGFLATARMAVVTWNGRAHVLSKANPLASVKVNGEGRASHVLLDGDSFTVGRSAFRYVIRNT